jgi:hypothetical protein
MVSFIPLPLYNRGKSPQYPFVRRLGPESCGEEKILALLEIEPGASIS